MFKHLVKYLVIFWDEDEVHCVKPIYYEDAMYLKRDLERKEKYSIMIIEYNPVFLKDKWHEINDRSRAHLF